MRPFYCHCVVRDTMLCAFRIGKTVISQIITVFGRKTIGNGEKLANMCSKSSIYFQIIYAGMDHT